MCGIGDEGVMGALVWLDPWLLSRGCRCVHGKHVGRRGGQEERGRIKRALAAVERYRRQAFGSGAAAVSMSRRRLRSEEMRIRA